MSGDTARPADLTNTEGKAWRRQDAKAKFLILSAMEQVQQGTVLVCETAKEMWDRLASIHAQKSATNKLLLTQRFHEYRMNSTDPVAQHIAKIQNMARELLDLGENIPDLVVQAKIISSLPSKYRNFRSAWNSVEPARQTLEYLQERLIQEEAFMDADSAEDATA